MKYTKDYKMGDLKINDDRPGSNSLNVWAPCATDSYLCINVTEGRDLATALLDSAQLKRLRKYLKKCQKIIDNNE